MRRVALATMVLVTLTLPAVAGRRVEGTVQAARVRWAGNVIVTEADVVGTDGGTTTVTALGGTIDGIGMSFSHLPAVVQAGDRVELDIEPSKPPVVVAARRAPNILAAGNVATYGVQRTKYGNVPLWRDDGCINFAYDTTTVTERTAHVIDQAFATWSSATRSCAALEFHSYRAPVTVDRDGTNAIVVRTDRWCRPPADGLPELCYPQDVAAVTRLVFIDNPSDPENGKILEADLELNEATFALLVPGESAPAGTPSLDLLSVITHETGHVLGLAHDCATIDSSPTDENGVPVPSCDDTDPSVTAATMFYRLDSGDLSKRDLAPNDIAGACALVEGNACTGNLSGGCCAGGARQEGVLLLVVFVMCRRRRAHSRSDRLS